MKQSQWNEAMNLLDTDLVESFVKKQENMAERKNSKVLWLRRGAVAACFMLIFAAFAGYFALNGDNTNSEVAAIITLDINPSFEIKIDKNEKVLEVNALNDDAKAVIADEDFRNQDLSEAVKKIVDLLIENGYLEDDITNAVLLSVDGKDQAKIDLIRLKLTELIYSQMGPDGVLIGEIIQNQEEEIDKFVREYGISRGKCNLILKLLDMYPRYSFDDLAHISISDLCILMNDSESFEITGSMKSIITLEEALQIGIEHFGLSEESNITRYGADLGYYSYAGSVIYSVRFTEELENMIWKYNIELNPVTGEVMDSSKYSLEPTEDYHQKILTNEVIDFVEAMEIACQKIGISKDDGYSFDAYFAYSNRFTGENPCGWYINLHVQNVRHLIVVNAETGKIEST